MLPADRARSAHSKIQDLDQLDSVRTLVNNLAALKYLARITRSHDHTLART